MRIHMPHTTGTISPYYRMVHPGRAGVVSEAVGAEVLVEGALKAADEEGVFLQVGPGVAQPGTRGSKTMSIS